MSDASEWIGRTLGHYRVVAQVGAGGMGVVYRARDEHLDREVAIKVLPPGTLADESARRRFRKEAEALSKLNHPNIQTVHDFSTQDGVDFLVTEYVEGVTLSDKLAAGPLREKEVARLGEQLADGLGAAHARNIVHRDLKPANLRLTPDGWLKILDFGLAKSAAHTMEDATASMTQSEGVAGTLPYMAPEQLRGEAADARTDLYAAGVVLYELATGRRPFEERVPTALAADIQHNPVPPPGRVNPQISSRMEEIILKCLEKEPENRYQSAKELQVDLRRLGASTTAPVSGVQVKRSARARTAMLAGIGLVVLLGVLAGLDVGGVRTKFMSRAGGARIGSLAVLPLANLSGDPEQEYFADGMTEALISSLAQIRALKVISRTSVMRYKGSKKSLPEIAGELGVDAVVEGTVARSGGRVRVTAELIRASTDAHLWASSYERDLSDALKLQSEVAQTIASEIRIQVTPQERERLAAARTVNPAAHEAYLLGRFFWNQRTEEGLQKGIRYFQKAIEQDPGYALAYVGLADSYLILAGYGPLSANETQPLAKQAAIKALELDSNSAEAHTSLGMVETIYDWDWTKGESEFRRAIELNPSYATAHHWYGHCLMFVGRFDESIAEMEHAKSLDPLSPIIITEVGYPKFFARRYDEAIGDFRKALELTPDFYRTHWVLAQAYEQKGMYAEAVAELQKAVKFSGGNAVMTAALAHAYGVSGEKAEAQKLLDELLRLSKTRYISPYFISEIYIGQGQKQEALKWLERAHEEHDYFFRWLKIDPRLDPLRSEPRFQTLLRQIGLSP